tara:strand:- start:3796 stop:4251 length:456 start_codon:yes stop_codon:yes gene_type:complete
LNQIKDPEKIEPNHWRCLNGSMWRPIAAVQVTAWRMLTRLRDEVWPIKLLYMMYLGSETLQMAQSDSEAQSENFKPVQEIVHLEPEFPQSNGDTLEADATVDLNVKGANFTAKKGTFVRDISLIWDSPEHIEGKVEEQQIVILTKFVKKQN